MRLGDLITPAKVERCGDREFPVLSMTMHDGIVLQADRFKKAIASKDQSTYKVVKPGQLVVGFPIDEGVLYVQGYDHEGIMSPAYNVWNVDTKQVDTRYLELALHSPQSMSFYKEKMRGTTARRRSLPAATLVELDIPVPERCEQVKVANTLLGIRANITDLKSLLERLNELVKSRFVEMFEHGQKWELRTLAECCATPDDIKCGPFGSQLHKEDYISEGIPVWGIPEVNSGFERMPDKFVSPENGRRLQSYSLVPGDVAMNRKGNVGQAALFDGSKPSGIIHSDVLRVRVNQDVFEPRFLVEQLHSSHVVREQVMSASTGAIMAGTNVTKLKKIKVFVPPLTLQQEFAAFVQQVDKLKFETQQAVEKLQMLYDSLAQEYFGS